MDYSDFSDYETTYSQDERIEAQIQKERQDTKTRNDIIEQKRKETFERIFEEKDDDIFNLRGLTFLKFSHLKIKFMFEPCQIVKHVSKKVAFFCSLKYDVKYGYWGVRRDSFPVNYKWKIYPIFCENGQFVIDDISLPIAIERIYKRLELWAKHEESFRLEKFMRYQNGEDIQLDSDDEELFLNEEQKQELYSKRKAILTRMIPPTKKLSRIQSKKRPKPRKLALVTESESDTSTSI